MKKIGLLLSLVVLFSFGANTAKAVTLADLEKTVTNLQQQVSSLQAQLGAALYSLQSSALSSSSSTAGSSAISSGTVTTTNTVTPSTTSTSVTSSPSSATSASTTTGTTTTNTTAPASSISTSSISTETTTVAPATTVNSEVRGTSSLNTQNTTTSRPTIATAKLGDRGANVLAIQKILKDRGYLKVTPNGTFGPSTQKAVRAFQSANKIYAGGGVGPATLRVLADASTDRVDVMTTDVSSASLLVTRNMAYPDQTVSTGTIHHKIGSYYVKNQSAVESVKVTGLLFGFTTGGTASVSQLTNIQAYNSSGVQIGATIPSIGSTATVSIASAFTLTPLASTVVDVYADIGTAPSGSGWRSNLLAGGVGLTSGATYNSGSSVSVQSVTIGTTTACTGTWAKVVSPNGGEVYTVGGTINITWNTCGHATSAPVQIGIRDSRYSVHLESGENTIVNTTNTGSYSWTIPAVFGSFSGGHIGGASVYTIVVYVGASGVTSFDESDTRFTINSGTSTGLSVVKNTAYANQTFASGSIDKKVASFFVQNMSSESIKVTGLQTAITSSSIPPAGFTNFKAVDGVGAQLGTTSSTFLSSTFYPGSSWIIPPGAAYTVELKVDIGSSVPAGSFIQTLVANGIGVTTLSAYTSGAPVNGQTITIGTTACTINSFTAIPSTISSGGMSTLSYSTTGCAYASISGFGIVGMASSGSTSTGTLYSTTTYTLTANGATGVPVTASVTVNVSGGGWTSNGGSSGNHAWVGAASDSTGRYLAAADSGGVTGGYIYTSNNYGVTWTTNGGSSGIGSWVDVASDSTGKYLVSATSTYGGGDGYVHTSNNYGVTWTTNGGSSGIHGWKSVASDSTGKYLVAADQNSAFGGYIYTSNNYGVTWTTNGGSSGSRRWERVASDATGKYLIASDSGVSGTGGYIYTSNNYGVTWTTNGGSSGIGFWNGVASDSTGRYLVADQITTGGSYIYTSNNYGVTWTTNGGSSGAHSWSGLASDSTGRYLIAGTVSPDCKIYTSNNYGLTWTLETGVGNPYSIWVSVGSSGDGTRLMASDINGGYIWTKN